MKELTKSYSRFNIGVLLIFAVCMAQFGFADTASAMLTTKANHDHIKIDFFYHGSTVSVKGKTDAGRDVVIKIASPSGHQVLKQKGKVGGLLWMNVGTLKFENTPNLYEVFSTRALDDILAPDELNKNIIGYNALKDHVTIEPLTDSAEKSKWFGEFVRFKEASKLYAVKPATVSVSKTPEGYQEYSLVTEWPYQAAPGDYTVTVYAIKDMKVVEQAQVNVRVEQVGIVKALSDMAMNRPAFYGLLSIGIALGAGFGVGMVFRKGGGSH